MNTYFTVALLFSITLMFYLLGYQPLLFNAMGKYCSDYPACYNDQEFDIFQSVISYIFNWNTALSLIAAVATIAVLGGLNLLVIVPFALVFIMLDFLVMPISFITEAGLPFPIPLILLIFFKLLTFFTVISFVRTGQ